MAFHFNNFHHQALGLEINGIPYNSFFSLPHQPCRLDLFIAAFVTVCCFAFSVSMRLFGTQVEKHKVSGELHFFPSILFHISSFSFSACLYSAVKLPSNLHMVAIVTTYPPSLCAWMCVCVRKFWAYFTLTAPVQQADHELLCIAQYSRVKCNGLYVWRYVFEE